MQIILMGTVVGHPRAGGTSADALAPAYVFGADVVVQDERDHGGSTEVDTLAELAELAEALDLSPETDYGEDAPPVDRLRAGIVTAAARVVQQGLIVIRAVCSGSISELDLDGSSLGEDNVQRLRDMLAGIEGEDAPPPGVQRLRVELLVTDAPHMAGFRKGGACAVPETASRDVDRLMVSFMHGLAGVIDHLREQVVERLTAALASERPALLN